MIEHDDRSVLIVGSKIYGGRNWRKKYPDAIGVDMLDGEGVDYVMNLESERLPAGKFSHIDCTSVLEHSKKPWAMAENLEQSLAIGGTISLSVPFVWRVHGYPSDYWRFTVEAVKILFPRITWEILHYESNKHRVKLPAVIALNDRPYFERTEVVGVGVRSHG